MAASRNCVKVVCYLLRANANIKIKDSKMRNMLHLIVNHTTNSIKSTIMNNNNNTDMSRITSPMMDSKERPDVPSMMIKESDTRNSQTYIALHSLHEVTKELIKV